ncbi:MAG: hypothetical protein CVU57_08785 [Deltaproteobacteria bacterium HGW-Deltaproteobacteria-15]|jgi:hypothetical protein|nr:MAG: hypothetical protein CVU57_08785 [Deltaproteobacteria bacterium HGW-Deltaproteobacteria-15]
MGFAALYPSYHFVSAVKKNGGISYHEEHEEHEPEIPYRIDGLPQTTEGALRLTEIGLRRGYGRHAACLIKGFVGWVERSETHQFGLQNSFALRSNRALLGNIHAASAITTRSLPWFLCNHEGKHTACLSVIPGLTF